MSGQTRGSHLAESDRVREGFYLYFRQLGTGGRLIRHPITCEQVIAAAKGRFLKGTRVTTLSDKAKPSIGVARVILLKYMTCTCAYMISTRIRRRWENFPSRVTPVTQSCTCARHIEVRDDGDEQRVNRYSVVVRRAQMNRDKLCLTISVIIILVQLYNRAR